MDVLGVEAQCSFFVAFFFKLCLQIYRSWWPQFGCCGFGFERFGSHGSLVCAERWAQQFGSSVVLFADRFERSDSGQIAIRAVQAQQAVWFGLVRLLQVVCVFF